VRGETFDLSQGGVLMRAQDYSTIAIGDVVAAQITEIGACTLRVVNRSHLGLHLQFVELLAASRAALESKLAAIPAGNKDLIDLSTPRTGSRACSRIRSRAMSSRRISCSTTITSR
jgi:hypothetical protein